MRASEGFTESERFLGSLCRKTFLSIWSHQNLFTDRGRTEKNKQGKELCDLLVIFGNDVIIFSDKQCSYPSTGNEQIDWTRWYKRAIKDSAKQIYGAEKWIRENPRRIFLDRFCEAIFPYDIPDPNEMRVHRVAVALGAGKRASEYFGLGSSGSLMIHTNIAGDDHTSNRAQPYCIGNIEANKGYIHVLDDYTLPILLNELDTIYDFIEYLKSKEEFFKKSKHIFAPGEEELLGLYLDSLIQHKQFPPPQIKDAIANGGSEAIQITEGFWADFQRGPLSRVRAAVRDDSLFYDSLIEHFASHLRAGTLAYDSEVEYRIHERNLRFLASEPRASRFSITVAWAKKIASTPRNLRTSISVASRWTGTLFVLLLLPKSIGQSDTNYRQERQAALVSYAYVSRLRQPEHRYVVCLGIEPGVMKLRRSEDLMSFDFADWSEDDEALARSVQAEMRILTDVEIAGTFDAPNIKRGDLEGGNRAERRRLRSIDRKRTR